MATTGIIERAWRNYQHTILDPIDAGFVQRQETRRAFYAGALSLFSGIMRGLTPDHDPTDDDLGMMDAIQAELQQYALDLAEGRA